MLPKSNRSLPSKTSHTMAKIKVDLHDVYNNSKAIDKALNDAFQEAIDKKIGEVEIIPGKGSGQLRKKCERFLQQPHIKPLYHRIENDSKNFGRLFVYFRF
jgi:dsDNA-specific endonuclease/ATPase MutS2